MKTKTSLRCVRAHLLAALMAVASGHVAALQGAAVEWRETDLTYVAEATVEAVRQATLAAQVTGRVLEARVDAGARVKAGEVLLRLDAREAQQALSGAQAQLAQVQAQRDRTRSLFAQKFVSQAALDRAEADYKTAAAGAGQAVVVGSHATVVAPFAGVVARRHIEPGEMATPGRTLLTLFDPRELRLVADIPQAWQGEVRRFLRARVELPGALPGSVRWLDAARVEMLPTADATTHGVRARVVLPAGETAFAQMLPGMFVRAHLVVGHAKKLVVPVDAILRRGELTVAYVLDDAQRPHLRQIRVGEVVADGMLEVLAGLTAGERVALDPVKAGFEATKGP